MGYFRAGTRHISDLMHRSRCADLAREMLRRANTPLQHGFAWGWVTHLLADIAVHPLINRATAELIGAAPGDGVTAAQHPASHLRVELGLDAYLQERCPELRRCGLGAALSNADLGFVYQAFQRTQGNVIRADDLRRAYAAMLRLTPLLLTLGKVSAAVQRNRRSHGPTAPRSTGGGWDRDVAGNSEGPVAVVHSFVAQASPRPWLLRAVRSCTRHFAGSFIAHQESGLRHLENHDLDTGVPQMEAELMAVELP